MYNQKNHQFDSFYNHKFGFHITGPRQDAFNEVLRLKPKVVKTLDFSVEVMKRIKQEIPDVFLIGRLFVHPQDFGQLSGGSANDARKKGVEMAERILREEVNRDIHHLNGQPIFNAWESLNEVFPEWTDENTQKLYDEYQVAFGQKMRAAGFEPVAFNFGQGNGNGEQWLKLYPGTLETYTYLGFHEYDWPTMDRLHQIGLNGPSEPHNLVPVVGEGRGNDGMWRCLRYRRVMNQGIRQRYGEKHTVIITECGMTQGVWGGSSKDIGPWAKQLTVPADIPGGTVPTPIPVDDYWKTLQWYNSEIMRDDYVMGACLFVTGASGKPEWETFEHLGPIMDRLHAFQKPVAIEDLPSIVPNPTPSVVIGVSTQPTPKPEPEPKPEPIPESKPEPEFKPASVTPQPPVVEPSAPPESKPEPPTVEPPPPPKPKPEPKPLPQPKPEPPAESEWVYTVESRPGMGLLVGDISVPNQQITIYKPNGETHRVMSGSKLEFGPGGFETYAQTPGKYVLEFLGEQFELKLDGQFTKVMFDKVTGPESVQVSFGLRDQRTTYAPGERVMVRIAVTNVRREPVSFGILGLLASTGQFQTSWSNGTIKPGQTFRHEDGMAFYIIGRYSLQLSMCFARKEACVSGKAEKSWVRFKPVVEFEVK